MHRLVRPGRKVRYRLAFALAMVTAVVAGWMTFGSTEASAHWPAPHLEVKCATNGGWAVSFTVESWKKSDKGGGGNPHIDVAYEVQGGQWVTLPWKSTYSFTKLNNYEFTDYFNVPASNASKIMLKVWTNQKWSDGYLNSSAKTSDWVSLPKNCGPKTTTTEKPHPTTTEKPRHTTTTCEEKTTTTKPTTSTTVEETTTTTKPTTSTTIEETTTTVPPTTVPTTVPPTTVPETTIPKTTVPPTTVPETTVPPTTAPPTTAKPTTTTTKAPTTTVAPTTTAPAPTTTVAVKSEETPALPVTGLQTLSMLALAGLLMLGGFLLIRAARNEF